MDNKAALLHNVDIFSGLSPELTDQLVRSLNSISLKKNTLIFGKDSEGDGLYIIRSGQVKVVLQNEEGKEIILATFQSGDFFGEMSLLDGRPRSANVFTTQNTQLLVLSRESLFQHIEQYPTTGLKILTEMSARLRRADEVIGNLVMLDAYGRVARVLIELSEQHGEVTEEGILIKERPTQQDMASMIGTTRETVSRILSDFQKRGLLSTEGKTILLSHGFMEAVNSRL
jgi:CRP-like cAMP-binding protein